MGTLTNYTDPRYQSAVPFGSRSHWLQMWRSYLETVPAAQVLSGVGTNFNWLGPHPEVIAAHMARAGIRRARIEVGWGHLDYATEQVTGASGQAAAIVACARAGMRPLIVLNANEGAPCPALARNTTLSAPLAPGARSAQLTSVAGISPGYTGLSYLPPLSLMAGHIITGVSGQTAALSRAYGGATLPAGRSVTLHTLKYRPFNAVGSADYAQTSAGWQTYARVVAQWVASLLGRTGRSDLGFDMELWNELSFGSNFLWIWGYYDPSPYPDPGGHVAWGAGSHLYQITLDTAQLWTQYPADFRGVALIQGFSNTIPWPGSSTQPPPITGISMHPYPPLNSWSASHAPPGTPVNAQLAVDQPGAGFEPQYADYFPEHYMCAIQTESHTRNVGPLSDGGGWKGRYVRGPDQPCWGWVTEVSVQPGALGVTDAASALHIKAKGYLRCWLGWLGKGTQGVLPWAIQAGGDLWDQQPLQSYLDYVSAHGSPAPVDEDSYTSPALAALRRACAHIGRAADVGLPPQWGTGQGVGTRQISVDWVQDSHDHAQFAGDGSPSGAHPPLFDRDCLYLQPLQANTARLVVIYYVMTRDMGHIYDQTRTGGAQYDLPEALFSVQFSGLRARGAQISVYDPVGDRDVPVGVRSATDQTLALDLLASDSPYLLTIQERTSQDVAASSYLQNARLNWMLGVAHPAAPAAQYVGLFSVAPTNTTAGTELSAGNYQRVQIGLTNPAAPGVVATGTTGSSTYAYQIVKKTAAGSTLAQSAATGTGVTQITNGNASLSSSNYNAISWTADAAAISYDVLKWSGTAWTLLGNTTSTTMNDTGQATQAYTVPTQNTTGWSTIVAGTTETISNALPLVWPVANVSWGTALACAIFDAPTGGNMLDFASLTSSSTISAGSQYSFPQGQLILGEL